MNLRSFAGLKFFPRCFRRHVYLRDQSIEVIRDILQSRYLRSNVAHKQLARTSLKENRQLFFTAKVRWFCLNFWIFSLTCAIPFVNFHGICFEFSSVHMISCCLISQDERLLIVLNNCRYVQNHVLPKLVESFRINEYPISDKLKKVLCMKTLSCVLKIKDC